jgi:hypothetical protein
MVTGQRVLTMLRSAMIAGDGQLLEVPGRVRFLDGD